MRNPMGLSLNHKYRVFASLNKEGNHLVTTVVTCRRALQRILVLQAQLLVEGLCNEYLCFWHNYATSISSNSTHSDESSTNVN